MVKKFRDQQGKLNALKEDEKQKLQATLDKQQKDIIDCDFKNVYEDVIFLTQLGILKIEEASTGRNQKKPILLCDKILFEMAA
jgi:predicted transcriptional regulator